MILLLHMMLERDVTILQEIKPLQVTVFPRPFGFPMVAEVRDVEKEAVGSIGVAYCGQ